MELLDAARIISQYLPHHHPQCKTSFLEFNGVTRRGEHYLAGPGFWGGCRTSARTCTRGRWWRTSCTRASRFSEGRGLLRTNTRLTLHPIPLLLRARFFQYKHLTTVGSPLPPPPRGVPDNKHSTDVESRPHSPPVSMSRHSQGESCSDRCILRRRM
jgi:hypothetical protein